MWCPATTPRHRRAWRRGGTPGVHRRSPWTACGCGYGRRPGLCRGGRRNGEKDRARQRESAHVHAPLDGLEHAAVPQTVKVSGRAGQSARMRFGENAVGGAGIPSALARPRERRPNPARPSGTRSAGRQAVLRLLSGLHKQGRAASRDPVLVRLRTSCEPRLRRAESACSIRAPKEHPRRLCPGVPSCRVVPAWAQTAPHGQRRRS